MCQIWENVKSSFTENEVNKEFQTNYKITVVYFGQKSAKIKDPHFLFSSFSIAGGRVSKRLGECSRPVSRIL